MTTEPVPDTGAFPDPRLGVPDSHIALRLLRGICDSDSGTVRTFTAGTVNWAEIDVTITVTPAELALLRRLQGDRS
jgi:hypothetical protein